MTAKEANELGYNLVMDIELQPDEGTPQDLAWRVKMDILGAAVERAKRGLPVSLIKWFYRKYPSRMTEVLGPAFNWQEFVQGVLRGLREAYGSETPPYYDSDREALNQRIDDIVKRFCKSETGGSTIH